MPTSTRNTGGCGHPPLQILNFIHRFVLKDDSFHSGGKLMKAVITVTGNDAVGIIAHVSKLLADNDINIVDISQTTQQGMFFMVMLVEIGSKEDTFMKLKKSLKELGEKLGQKIHIRHEKVFNSMHRI